MVEMSKEKFNSICEKYNSLIMINGDVEDALNFVCDLLCAEADATKEKYPWATKSIKVLENAAYAVWELCRDIEKDAN